MKNPMQKRNITKLFKRNSLTGVAVLSLLAQPLMAAEFENVSDVKGCRAITSNAERLLCYDTIADGGVFNEQQAQQAKIESFGSVEKEREPDSDVDQLTVSIVRVQESASNVHYFHTADGAVWKQSNGGALEIESAV